MNNRSLDWSKFGLKNNSRTSGNSYSTHTPHHIIDLVSANWNKAIPGQGETDLNRKILVPVYPEGFFCPPRAKLVKGMALKAEVKFRQEGEDPFIEVFVEEDEARNHDALIITPAARVDIVCYSDVALLENNGERSGPCDWEIVCILATTGQKEPMLPLAMARNFLEKAGGTKSDYTATEFAEAIYYWASQSGVKVRLNGPDWNWTPA